MSHVVYSAEVKRQDTLRFLQALRLQGKMGASLVTADSPWSPTLGLLLGTVLPASCAVAVWERRRAVALAQMARQSGRDQWEIMHLAIVGVEAHAHSGTDNAHAWLLRLLDEACRLAGARRISGIIARVPDESCLLASFHQAGFTATMEEFTYVQASLLVATATDVPGLRKQEKRDAWPLHQLYLRSTPQVVQMSEGRTARDWQVKRSSSRFSFQVKRWVVEDREGLTGWLSEYPGRRGTMRVQMGVAPGHVKLAQGLVATAQKHAREAGNTGIWSRVPAHATDVRQALEDGGFVETDRDVVLKRSLAVRARDLAPAREAKRRMARSGLTATQSRAWR